MAELREFLFATVYPRALEQAGGERVRRLLTQLMRYYLEHPECAAVAAAAGRRRGGRPH